MYGKCLTTLLKKKGTCKAETPNYFVTDNNIILNKTEETADSFIQNFVKVGWNLAKVTEEPRDKDCVEDVTDMNSNSIFIWDTDEQDMLDIVKTFKNKKSTDCLEIDMSLIKNIIQDIVKPLTYVCN